MPQYTIKIKNLDNRLVERVTVWASNKRAAEKQALDVARRLLATKNVELV